MYLVTGCSEPIIRYCRHHFSSSGLRNKSISSFQHFPRQLKNRQCQPLFKLNNSKDNNRITNYRPISLLLGFSKIFEKVVFKQVYSYLQNHKLLFKNQFGLRKAHSTDLAALQLIDSIYEYLDKRKIPFAIRLIKSV